FCDNDVDAADLHLILKPQILEQHTFDSGSKAFINNDLCIDCGLCEQNCRFDAIHRDISGTLTVNQYQCEGCRLCERICPVEAISSKQYNNNNWFISDTRFGKLVHAKMGAGEENSGKLVTNIRTKAREIATDEKADYIISDGSPGIGCPVIASITGTDIVLLVIEPSLTGLHDAQRLFELVESFKIQTFALINKSDINPYITQKVKLFLKEKNIPLLGEIPFDTRFVDAMIKGETIIENSPDSDISEIIKLTWKQLIKNI
ncbi:MAG: 4Fe-4S binding protein, partial [Prolixibacteraceae bacterium]|nr:4Fe-4S binding protein [Prolixibacteraceae bacterium]